MVVMNAATSIITTKSPYIARTSLTIPQLEHTLGTGRYKNGVTKVYTMVADYGPGHRRRDLVHQGLQGRRRRDRRFGAHGGRQSGFLGLSCRSAKDVNPEAVFIFIPGGAQPAGDGQGAGTSAA